MQNGDKCKKVVWYKLRKSLRFVWKNRPLTRFQGYSHNSSGSFVSIRRTSGGDSFSRLTHVLPVCLINRLSHIVFGKPMFCLPTPSSREEPVCRRCAFAVSTFLRWLTRQSPNLAHVLAPIWPQFYNFQQKTGTKVPKSVKSFRC